MAFVRDHAIACSPKSEIYEFTLLSLDRIPLTYNGRIGFQVENVLAATAACWALGLPAEQIRLGLESFSAQMDKVPARFNVFEVGGATVIVDYGHNPSSLAAILAAIEPFPQQMRSAVYSVAGDRRDSDIIRRANCWAKITFDRVLLYEDQYLRGRPQGEIIGLLRAGLSGARRTKEMQAFSTWGSAADAALRLVRPGELLLLQADSVDVAVNHLQSPVPDSPSGHKWFERLSTRTARSKASVLHIAGLADTFKLKSTGLRRHAAEATVLICHDSFGAFRFPDADDRGPIRSDVPGIGVILWIAGVLEDAEFERHFGFDDENAVRRGRRSNSSDHVEHFVPGDRCKTSRDWSLQEN